MGRKEREIRMEVIEQVCFYEGPRMRTPGEQSERVQASRQAGKQAESAGAEQGNETEHV